MPLDAVSKDRIAKALRNLLAFEDPDSKRDQETDPRLREARARAVDEAERVVAIIDRKEPLAFGCCECSARFSGMDEAYQHLRKVHHYPDEDASVGIRRLYD